MSNTSRQSAGIAAAVVAVAMAAAVGIGSLVGGDSASTTVANNAALTPIEQTAETPTITTDEPNETQTDGAEDEAASSTGSAGSIAAPAASSESATSDTPAQTDAPATATPSRSNTRRRAPSSDADVSGIITVGTQVQTSGDDLQASDINTTVYVALWNKDTEEYVKGQNGKIWVQGINVTNGTPGDAVTFDGLPAGNYGIWEMIPDPSAADGYRGFASGVDMIAGSSDASKITARVSTSVGSSNDNTITIDKSHQTGSGTIINTYARVSDTRNISAYVIWDNRVNPGNDQYSHQPPAGAWAKVELYCNGEATGKIKTVTASQGSNGDKVEFDDLPRYKSDGTTANVYTIRILDYSYTGIDVPDSNDSRTHFYPQWDGDNKRYKEAGDNEKIVLAKKYGKLKIHKDIVINNGGDYKGTKNELTFTITGPHGYEKTITLKMAPDRTNNDDPWTEIEHLPAGVYHIVESGYDSMLPSDSGWGWVAESSWAKTNSPTEDEAKDTEYRGQTSIDVVVYSGGSSEDTSEGRFNNYYDKVSTVNVTVTKVWDDNNNTAGKRPSSIKVQLKSNGNVEDTVTLSKENNWQYTWENKSNLNTYEVVEVDSPSGYDEPKIVKNGNNFTITNTYKSSASSTPELVVNKTLDGVAPPAKQFNFVATGEDGKPHTATNDGTGKVTFTDLPPITAEDFKNTDGTFSSTITRTYTVSEVIPADTGDIEYDDSTYTAVLTATLNTQSDEIDFSWSYPSKVLTADYKDNGDGTGTVTFYSNGSVVKAETVTVANLNDGDNRYTYEENNETCAITLTKVTTEETTNPLVLAYDVDTGKITATLDGVALDANAFTITDAGRLTIGDDKSVTIPAPNSQTTHTVSASATSNGNTYTAKLDIVVAPKANALQVTYHDLGDGRGWFEVHHNSSDVSNHGQDLSITPTNGGPECIGYTNGTKAVDFSSANLSAGTHQYKYEVSHGGESVYVTVTVEVTEGDRPSLTYKLEKTTSGWYYSAQFDAAGNQYDGKHAIVKCAGQQLDDDVLNGSTSFSDKKVQFLWHTNEFTNVELTLAIGWQTDPIKSWTISSAKLTDTLYGDPVKKYKLTGAVDGGADFELASWRCYDNEVTTKKAEIANVVTVPVFIGSTETAPTFVNTTTKTSTVDVIVTKVWDDADNQDGIRPDSVSVQLKAGSAASGSPVELSASNNWTHTWEGLPEKDASGNNISYTVEETSVPTGYTASVTGSARDGFTITNTHTPETTEAKVVKVWDDADNADGLRPTSLVMTLSNGQTVTLNEGNNWQATISGLPKYANGTLIPYTWTEAELPDGYTQTGSKTEGTVTTITNTHTPQITAIKVTKKWTDDNDNANSTRKPIYVHLFNASGTEVGSSKTIYEIDNWTATFDNLPVIVDGTAVDYTKYTLTEDDVEGYTSTVGHITKNDDGTYSVEVENTLKPVNLTVSKAVTGAMADMTKEFDFSISVNGGTAQTFKLKHGDELTPDDVANLVGRQLHYGDKVTITETAAAGYTTTYTVNGGTATSGTSTGELTLKANTTVAFTNDKDSVAVTGIAETIATSPLVHIIAVGLVTAAVCVAITRARRERGVR